MIIPLIVSIMLFSIGLWLFYLNHQYAGVEPLLQNGFVCLVGGILLFCGIWANNFQITITAPWTVIFPLCLVGVFFLITTSFPRYSYEEAKQLIMALTNDDIYPKHHTNSSEDGMYSFYTDRRYYLVDPETGEIFEQYALTVSE